MNFQESTILNACTKSLETYWMHHILLLSVNKQNKIYKVINTNNNNNIISTLPLNFYEKENFSITIIAISMYEDNSTLNIMFLF